MSSLSGLPSPAPTTAVVLAETGSSVLAVALLARYLRRVEGST